AGRGRGGLAHDEREVLLEGLDAGVDAGEGEAEGKIHGRNLRRSRRPAPSSHPQARLRFCTAWPAAPFTRLSMALQARKRSPCTAKPIRQRLVPTTWAIPTSPGAAASETNGASA